jgi:hypothetical protein
VILFQFFNINNYMDNFKQTKLFLDNKQIILKDFDYKFYLSFYPSIRDSFKIPCGDIRFVNQIYEMKAKEHFIFYGFKEGKLKNKKQLQDGFCPKFYIHFYPDIKETYKDDYAGAYHHYLNGGKQEGRLPSKYKLNQNIENIQNRIQVEFNNLETYKDDYAGAYHHYLNGGKQEGRLPSKYKLNQNIENIQNRIQVEFNNLETDTPLINILIRTSNRPNDFEECINSILTQTYTNYRVIICYDKEESLHYLKKFENNENIEYDSIYIDSEKHYKFNLYCNHLMSKVSDGWIIFLDDDDKLCHKYVLNELVNHIRKGNNTDNLFIWNFFRPDKLVFPKNINDIILGEIDTCNFCFHSKFKEEVKWGDKKCGDYRFFKKLIKKYDFNLYLINKVFTQTNFIHKLGNFGN